MKGLIIFLSGAALGGVVAWKIAEKKYTDIAEEEIESVVKRFEDRRKELENEYNEKKKEIRNEETNKEIIKNLSYGVDISTEEDKNVEETKVVPSRILPYVISEDEYGEKDYDEVTLLYYADKVLADDEDNVIENILDTVGYSLNNFEKDQYLEQLLVRNEEEEVDYTILKSLKTYSEQVEGYK